MRKSRTFTISPNPYGHVDPNGRLAGATPVGEMPRPTTTMPSRTFVGAVRKTLETDGAGRGPQYAQQSRSEYQFIWGTEPVTVDASGQLASYYQQLANNGEIFILAEGSKDLPLAKLAAARAAAIRQYRAEQSHEAPVLEEGVAVVGTGCPKLTDPKASCDCISDPDASEWAEQFPLDGDVALAADLLAKQADANAAAPAAEAEKSAADEKAKADAAAKAAADAAEKKAADAAVEAEKRVRLALGIAVAQAPPTTTPVEKPPATPRRAPSANTDPAKES